MATMMMARTFGMLNRSIDERGGKGRRQMRYIRHQHHNNDEWYWRHGEYLDNYSYAWNNRDNQAHYPSKEEERVSFNWHVHSCVDGTLLLLTLVFATPAQSETGG